MSKRKCFGSLIASVLMLVVMGGCKSGLEEGQKRMDQIANGETTFPVIAPQTVGRAKEDNAPTIVDANNADILLEDFTLAPYVPQEIPEPIRFEGNEIDLTTMSSTMIYAQVLDILSNPDNYLGKHITMSGIFAIYQSPTTGDMYYSCLIPDATMCCLNGIEFVRAGNYSYPEDYPDPGDSVRVVGTFDTYEEDGYIYCRLRDAVMDKIDGNT